MIVDCVKCNKRISTARLFDDPTMQNRKILEVFCHGEKDIMYFDREWELQNQDFVFMIQHNMTIGKAFSDPDKEYEKVEVGKE